MPDDMILADANTAVSEADAYLQHRTRDPAQRDAVMERLAAVRARLDADIRVRTEENAEALDREEETQIASIWAQLKQQPAYMNKTHEQNGLQAKFDELRMINNGGFPRNISPVLYVIPLIALGVGEWYVNYSTFAAEFVPAFAIATTVIIAVIFAFASHLHGAYLKQLREIHHPSYTYHFHLGRKLVIAVVTVCLLLALLGIGWARYIVISEQLGIGSGTAGGVFSTGGTGKLWSLVLQTVFINVVIWGIGTAYSWVMHEEVPELRETYRHLQRKKREVDRLRRSAESEDRRLHAEFARKRQRNSTVLRAESDLLTKVIDREGRAIASNQ